MKIKSKSLKNIWKFTLKATSKELENKKWIFKNLQNVSFTYQKIEDYTENILKLINYVSHFIEKEKLNTGIQLVLGVFASLMNMNINN